MIVEAGNPFKIEIFAEDNNHWFQFDSYKVIWAQELSALYKLNLTRLNDYNVKLVLVNLFKGEEYSKPFL